MTVGRCRTKPSERGMTSVPSSFSSARRMPVASSSGCARGKRSTIFAAPRTLVTLAVGFVWWEVWFYLGHRLLHTRWLYPLHRPHHATRGLHPSLSFSAGETVVLSSGFYIPLALASQLYEGVSAETLALVFSGAYVLNVLSHLDVGAFEGTAVGPLLGSARRHARHHAGRRGNYGLNSAWLDRACGTEAAG